MQIRIRDTGQIMSVADFKLEFYYVSFPALITQADIDPQGADLYFDTVQPEGAPLQSVVEVEPVQEEDGTWHQTWAVIPWEQTAIDVYLQRVKDEIWIDIKRERDRRKYSGVKVGNYWFHSDDPSRIQQIGLVMMGANIPTDLQWKTLDGFFVTMTNSLAVAIFQTIAYCDQTNFKVAEVHRAALNNSSDPTLYDYSTNWLPSYL